MLKSKLYLTSFLALTIGCGGMEKGEERTMAQADSQTPLDNCLYFIGENLPDGTILTPHQRFDKHWQFRLKNECVGTYNLTDYRIVKIGGRFGVEEVALSGALNYLHSSWTQPTLRLTVSGHAPKETDAETQGRATVSYQLFYGQIPVKGAVFWANFNIQVTDATARVGDIQGPRVEDIGGDIVRFTWTLNNYSQINLTGLKLFKTSGANGPSEIAVGTLYSAPNQNRTPGSITIDIGKQWKSSFVSTYQLGFSTGDYITSYVFTANWSE